MSTKKIRGFILKEVHVGEADKIITVMAKDVGRCSISCRGARKTKSKFLAGSQCLSYCDFVLFEGKSFYSLTQVELIEPFYAIRNDLTKFCYASYFSELIEKTTLENLPNNDALRLLLKTLMVVARMDTASEITLAARVFELRFLTTLGFMPEVGGCIVCGDSYQKGFVFDGFCGGLLCRNHHHAAVSPVSVSRAAIDSILYILTADIASLFRFTVSEAVLRELSIITRQLVQIHIEIPLKTREMLEKLELE